MTGSPALGGRAPVAGAPVAAAAWAALVPLAGAAVARLARFDGHPLLSMANAGTPFVYLPAYGALAVGVRGRRPALAAAAAAVAAAHVVWTAPEVRLRRRVPRAGAAVEGTRLRVVSANIRFPSRDSAPLGRELASLGADVLVLQELSSDHLITIKGTGALDGFPYAYVDARSGSFGAGIWSRYPLSEEATWNPAGLPMVRATLDVDGTHVRVFNVHARAPMRRRWIGRFKEQMRALAEAAQAGEGPVIMAGDFNATYGMEPFRRLLAAARLRDAHVEAGRGLRGLTWPRGARVMPPLFRLDHILVSPELTVLDAREGAGHTSDHRPVVADVVVAPGEPGVSAGPASPPAGS